MELITPEMVTSFTDFLKKAAKGEGAHKSYYMFRTVILHAIEEGLMKKNPCKGIVIHRDVNTLKKEILTMDEIKHLASTPITKERTRHYNGHFFFAVSPAYAGVIPLASHTPMSISRQGYYDSSSKRQRVEAHTAVSQFR